MTTRFSPSLNDCIRCKDVLDTYKASLTEEEYEAYDKVSKEMGSFLNAYYKVQREDSSRIFTHALFCGILTPCVVYFTTKIPLIENGKIDYVRIIGLVVLALSAFCLVFVGLEGIKQKEITKRKWPGEKEALAEHFQTATEQEKVHLKKILETWDTVFGV